MTQGDYAIQIYDPSGKRRVEEHRFENFDKLLRYIESQLSPSWQGRVKVHLPARATDEERAKIKALGFEST